MQVLISIENERESTKLCVEDLERPELDSNGFAQWPRAALMARLDRAEFAPVPA